MKKIVLCFIAVFFLTGFTPVNKRDLVDNLLDSSHGIELAEKNLAQIFAAPVNSLSKENVQNIKSAYEKIYRRDDLYERITEELMNCSYTSLYKVNNWFKSALARKYIKSQQSVPDYNISVYQQLKDIFTAERVALSVKIDSVLTDSEIIRTLFSVLNRYQGVVSKKSGFNCLNLESDINEDDYHNVRSACKYRVLTLKELQQLADFMDSEEFKTVHSAYFSAVLKEFNSILSQVSDSVFNSK